jgi:cephalosporin hydroxylase
MLPVSRTRAAVLLACVVAFSVACNRRNKSTEAPSGGSASNTPSESSPVASAPASAAPDDPYAPKVSDFMVADKVFEKRLLRGFYDTTGGWRWTARKFAVSLDVPQPVAPMFLEMDFTAPNEVMNQVPKITLVARVNNHEIARQEYNKAGRYYFKSNVPLDALQKTPAQVEFEVDQSIKDSEHGGRELSLIVVGLGLKYVEEPKVGPEREAQLAREGYKQLLAQRKLMMPLDKQNDLMKLFHELPVWRHMWFHNVPIEKNPLDLWMMQQIMYEVQPDFVVETGTFRGGSALYWAHTLNGLGLEKSRVLTVDISDYVKGVADAHPLWKKYVTFYLGSSTDPAIVAKIAQTVKGKKVIVTLDSDHTMKHVLEELKLYAPMVSRGSYLVVEDTHMDGVPTAPGFGPGPLAATRKFLADGGSKDFEQDLTREAYVMTFNPGGWLRRK